MCVCVCVCVCVYAYMTSFFFHNSDFSKENTKGLFKLIITEKVRENKYRFNREKNTSLKMPCWNKALSCFSNV